MDSITRTTKFAIYFEGYNKNDLFDKSNWNNPKTLYGNLFATQKDISMAMNKITSVLFSIATGLTPRPTKADKKTGLLKAIGNQNIAYRLMNGTYQTLYPTKIYQPSATTNQLMSYNLVIVANTAEHRFQIDYRDFLKGQKSIASFKEQPIFLGSPGIKFEKDTTDNWDGYIYLKIFQDPTSKNKAKVIKVRPSFGKDAEIKTILMNCAKGIWKHGSAKLTYEKSKWHLHLSYTFTPEVNAAAENIMGVDAGMAKTATVSVINPAGEEIIPKNFNQFFSYPQDLIASVVFTKREKSRRSYFNRDIFQQRTGKGRKRKLRNIEKLSGKVENKMDTMDEQLAAAIINEAKKHNVKRIQIEELTHWSHERSLEETQHLSRKQRAWIRDERKIKFRASLLDKIKNAAEKAGIEFKKVSAAYTSTTCFKCGINYGWSQIVNGKKISHQFKVINGQKFGRISQAEFVCQCGYKHHADKNAALNIAKR